MKQFTQDGNVYEFPDDWLVVPAYDELPFFKHLSGNQAIMAKGCDIVAVCSDELWLIEAKDYDRKSMKETRPKFTELATTIARKGFDTLAGLQVDSREQLKQNTVGLADKVYVTQNRDEKAWKKWASHKDSSTR